MTGSWQGILLVGVLVASGAVALAQPQSEVSIHPHKDLLFTDVRKVEDLTKLGTSGYAAATQGGLALWWGDGPRNVVTRMDGLPSSVVWSISPLEDRLLVGTESGVAIVDPEGPSVEPVEVPEHVRDVTDGAVVDTKILTDGSWYLVERSGHVAERSPDGTWTVHDPPVSRAEVTAFHADDDHVLLGVKVRGLYTLDDAGQWERLARPSEDVSAVAVYDDRIFLGAERSGLRVLDLDGEEQTVDLPDLVSPERSQPLTILTQRVHGDELWIGTPLGYAVHDASSDTWRVTGHEKLPHRWVQAIVPLASESQGAEHDEAAVGTLQGVGWPRFDIGPHAYDLHTTVNGPATGQMRGLGVLDGEIWAATQEGLAIHLPDRRTWVNLGAANGIPFSLLNAVDFDETRGVAWMAAMGGAVGMDLDERTWHLIQDQSPISDPPNVYLDLEVDGRYMWMPEYWNGLIRYDIEQNRTDRFDIEHGLMSRALTCTERWNEFLVVCAQDVVQVFNLSQATPRAPLGPSYDLCSGPRCDNYPANSTITALADGPRLWLGTADGGLALVERDPDEGVKVTGHWDPGDGLPAHEVRALAPAPDGVWAGTLRGLSLVTLEEGVVQTWDREDGLDDPTVNGLAEADDILYVSTLSGLYRLDLDSRAFLPLFEAGGEFNPPDATLRITYPSSGAVLHRPVNMTGTLVASGHAVDGVEVRIDDGEWEPAEGTISWRYRLPVDELPAGEHTIEVRATADGEAIAELSRTFTVGDPDAEVSPPRLEHRTPRLAEAGSPLNLEATVEAADPVRVLVEAEIDQRIQETEARVVGQTATATLHVPQGAQGEVTYRFHVSSGGGEASFPEDGFYDVPIIEQGSRAIDLALSAENPAPISLAPGGEINVPVTVTNEGDHVEDLRILPSGLRPSWVSVDSPVILPPGQTTTFDVTITVPEDALPTSTLLLLTIQPRDGALVETLSLPVQVTGSPDIQADGPPERGTPGPGAPGVVLVGLVAGLVAARLRRGSP